MNKKVRTTVTVLAVAIFAMVLDACNKDINVNAEWEDITVIFGLLDQNQDTQFVKINKAFLGEADAFDMAQVRDSSEYQNLTAYVEEWKDNQKLATFALNELEITDKEEGVFYSPNQTIYYFTVPDNNGNSGRLDSLAKYKLFVILNEGTSKEKIVTTETEIIDGFGFGGSYLLWVTPGTGQRAIDFANSSEITDQELKIIPKADAKRFEIYGIFNYDEVYDEGNGNSGIRQMGFEFKLGGYTTSNLEGGKERTIAISGEQFFLEVGKNVPVADETIIKRVVGVGSFQLKIVAAGDDLNTFMEVNEPTTGIVQEKKEFTNVNNGIGIFSSRTSTLGSLKLGEKTINELMNGDLTSAISNDSEGYTVGRKFCNDDISSTQCESCNTVVSPCY